jgi:hypothetical protein
MTRLLAACALAACATSVADTPKQETPERKFEKAMMTRFHMHQNFDLVRAIERLLIRRQLNEAQRFASAIEASPDSPSLSAWQTYVTRVRVAAGEVARAPSVDDAIRKTAELGGICGSCHGATRVSADFGDLPRRPEDKPGLDARMARHRWAADRLWEGVVGNNDTAWFAGLDVLASEPVELPDDRMRLARELQRLAREARRPKPGPMVDRATSYGEILVTCAGCHR